ncbi:putative secreted protein (Por secretion system target) [Dyadobacter jejuensis]|uniref:Putative secreted protein (Por secretion system target) n=1 Tax=Dyadobacter jejuensis TaxID=1082580 RepID=A0A316AKQ0_9BACT|nr:T9SS type A sorting domain-containing protein [Dyadobacter jejuensis]PWJ58072.1 putative secreted protein (Por secretion system target) [Dyadobacter jejuensis]
MKNFIVFLAAAALLASGLSIQNSTKIGSTSVIQRSDGENPENNRLPNPPFNRKTSKQSTLLIPTITATNTYLLTNDIGLPGASAGDELEYTVTITNSGTDANGVSFTDQIDANTTLVAGSVKVSPIAQNDTYTTIGNVGLDVSAGSGLLANDISPDAATLSISGAGAIATSQGGVINLNYTTGAFSYVPPAGFTGNDTFTYTLQNGSGFTSIATATITSAGAIWFVNSGASSSGENGTLAKPFTSIASLQAINDGGALHPKTGHTIFIYQGNYSGPLTLLDQQKLVGQGAAASLLSISGYGVPNGNSILPTTGGTRPTLTSSGAFNVINTAATNTIRGLNIGASGGAKLAGSTAGTVTISEVGLSGSGRALNMSNVTFAAEFSEVSSTVASGSVSPINISNSGGSLRINSGSISSTGVTAIQIAGSSLALNVTLVSVSCNSAAKGISVSGTTGTFRITGVGTTQGSGGTIQNITGRGIDFSTAAGVTLSNINLTNANTQDAASCGTTDNAACNAAVYANVVDGFKLEKVIISGTVVQHGINLKSVNNLVISNSSVANAGDEVNEGALFAINTTGTSSITNSTFANTTVTNAPSGRVAYFGNTNTNLTLLTVDNSIFKDAPNNGGILMEGYGTSQMKMKITGGSQFLRCQTQGIKMIANNSSQLVGDIRNAIVNNVALDGTTKLTSIGIDLHSLGTSSLKYNVISNNFKCKNGPGINLKMSDNSFQEGTVDGNVVTSDGGGGFGIFFDTEGASAKGVVKISNNTISGILFDSGIGVWGYSPNNTTKSDVTVSGNNISTGAGAFYDIDVNLTGTLTDNKAKLCVNISNNTVAVATGTALRLRPGAVGNEVILQGTGNTLATVWSANANTPPNASVFQAGSGLTSYNTGQTCAVPNVTSLRVAVMEEATSLQQIPVGIEPSGSTEAKTNETTFPTIATELKSSEPSNITGNMTSARTTATMSGETVSVNGSGSGFSLPAAKNVIVKFKATINNSIPASTCQVTNQGTVSGSGFSNVLTDDPTVTGPSNPTVTALISAPTISTCPSSQVVNPDNGTCTATLSLPATAEGCPTPATVYSVAGNPITFPYTFPTGLTTVLVTATNGIGSSATCSYTVTVTPTPAPNISQNPIDQEKCAGENVSFSVAATGTINDYQWQKKPFGGAFTNITSASNPTAITSTLTLMGIQETDDNSEYQCVVSNPCASSTSTAAVLTVNKLATSTLSGTVTVNQGVAPPTVTFSATGGTLPYTFSYSINTGMASTLTTTGLATSVGITQPTEVVGVFTYELLSVTDALGCMLTPATPQTVAVTIGNNLTATISAATTGCVGEPSPQVTFTAQNGIPPYTFTYKMNGGADTPLNAIGSATTASVSVPTTSSGNFTYELISVSGSGGANSPVTGQSNTVGISDVPSIVLSGAEYSCSIDFITYSVYFTATDGATVTTDTGTVSGNSVIDIPSNQTATITATKNGCSSSLSVFRNCALPVTLIDFSATEQENSVILKWRTSSETNSERFDIEHSIDGKQWRTIGTKKAASESSEIRLYTFTDPTPDMGDNFYRLKMIDRGADSHAQTFSYSRIVFVGMSGPAILEIFPNPVADFLTIKSQPSTKIESIELYNLRGALVYKSGRNIANTIPVHTLPVGLYMLTIQQKSGVISHQKILVDR